MAPRHRSERVPAADCAHGVDYRRYCQALRRGAYSSRRRRRNRGQSYATRTDQISIDLTGFDPGESFSFYFDPDTDGANDALNYRTILFNNGGNTANAILRVRDEAGALEQLELPDPGAADLASYTFSSVARPRTITVKSV